MNRKTSTSFSLSGGRVVRRRWEGWKGRQETMGRMEGSSGDDGKDVRVVRRRWEGWKGGRAWKIK